ncbi:MAG: GNAT family N-acetyltransferase [Planctomycetota bacterium]|jgi:putative acetyltransferase
MVIIRQETVADVEAITAVTKLAFAGHPFSQQSEHFIVCALRAASVMRVSLVAEVDGVVVGHIAFSPVTFTDSSADWYGLGPVSVTPERQNQGIGSRLVNEGLARLKELGAAGCVLVGDPAFYKRFGFASPAGLSHEGVPQENVLALRFNGSLPQGQVQFHEAFGATE